MSEELRYFRAIDPSGNVGSIVIQSKSYVHGELSSAEDFAVNLNYGDEACHY